MSTPTLRSTRAPFRRPRPRPRLEPLPGPDSHTQGSAGSRRTSVLVAAGMAVVLVVFSARCWQVAVTDSITSDESTHLTHCLHYWATGDDFSMWELGSARLA